MLQALLDKSLARIDDFGPTDAAKPFGCSLLANLGAIQSSPRLQEARMGFGKVSWKQSSNVGAALI